MSPLLTRLIAVDDPAWADRLETIPHDFYHLPAYLSLEAEAGGAAPLGCLAEDGDRSMFVPLLSRAIPGSEALHATSPYGYPGPVWSPAARHDPAFREAAIESCMAALADRGVVSAFFRLHPILSPEVAISGQVVRHGQTVAVDLSLPEEEQWRQARKGHRHEINRARREGLEVELDASGHGLDEFEEIYHETMRRVGAGSHYFLAEGYVQGLHEALAGRLWLGTVRAEGRTVSAALFPEIGGIVQFHLSGTRDEALRLHPSKLLLDGVRRWAAARGNRFFHLGGGVGSTDDSLFAFKAGFSRLRFRFSTWRFVLDRATYAQLVAAHAPDSSPDDLGGHFPPFPTG